LVRALVVIPYLFQQVPYVQFPFIAQKLFAYPFTFLNAPYLKAFSNNHFLYLLFNQWKISTLMPNPVQNQQL